MYILDVQGFQYKNNEFICKEIAIINITSGKLFCRQVNMAQPLHWFNNIIIKHIKWTTKNVHGLSWDSVSTNPLPNECISLFVRNIIKKKNDKVFVKGLQKKMWLSKIVNNEIIDLLDLGCINLKQLKLDSENFHCKNHQYDNNLNCAKEHVHLLRKWFNNKPINLYK